MPKLRVQERGILQVVNTEVGAESRYRREARYGQERGARQKGSDEMHG